MGASLAAKGIFHARLPDDPNRFFIENLGYTFGFIIVIMARQQLFTENTVTAVLPIMHKPTPRNLLILLRLWGVVLLGNLIGTGPAALAFTHMPLFDAETRGAFVSPGEEVMRHTPGEMFANGVPPVGSSPPWCGCSRRRRGENLGDRADDLPVAICDLTHIVVGSVEILYLVFNGAIGWQEFIYPFALPTLAGNIIGGTFIFALISHAQIRNDLCAKTVPRVGKRKSGATAGKNRDRGRLAEEISA